MGRGKKYILFQRLIVKLRLKEIKRYHPVGSMSPTKGMISMSAKFSDSLSYLFLRSQSIKKYNFDVESVIVQHPVRLQEPTL